MRNNRYRDAVMIQQGACNPSGIAHAVIEACREAWDQELDACKDAAVRLMIHQLAWVCGVREIDNAAVYCALMNECKQKAGIEAPKN